MGLYPQPQADPGCLLQGDGNLVRGGSNTVVSQKHRAKDGPSLELGLCLILACDEATFCFPIRRLVSAKEVKVNPPNIAYHFRMRRSAYDPAEGERLGKIYIQDVPHPV